MAQLEGVSKQAVSQSSLLAAGRLEPVLAAARDVRSELGADEPTAGGETV